jgi:DNA uptake protein ComE-like DNA-binding protein
MTRTAILAAAFLVSVPAFAGVTPAPVAGRAHYAKMMSDANRLNVNTASPEQLAAVLAEAIVKARPYRNVEDLTEKSVVPGDVLSAAKDKLVAR